MTTTNGAGNGLAIAGPPKKEDEAEKVQPAEAINVPAALLLACESISAKKAPEETPNIAGVYLHVRDGRGRAVATDGHRTFVGSFELPTKEEGGTPSWLNAGLVVSNEGLKAKAGLLVKVEGVNSIRITHIKGNGRVELSDNLRNSVFSIDALRGSYPDYERKIGPESFGMVKVDDDGNPIEETEHREWQTVGINSSYLKSCGDVAKILDAGLPREMRSKEGMIVRAFAGGSDQAPLVFCFEGYPGSILALIPTPTLNPDVHRETAALLSHAAKGTINALRAHQTRQLQRAENARTDWEKQEAQAKARDFAERIAKIMGIVPGPALGHDKPKPERDPAPEFMPAPEPDPEPEPPAVPMPSVRRTKMNPRNAN